MPADGIVRILITAPDKETLSKLLREQKLDLGCASPRKREDGTLSVEAYVPEQELDRLRDYGVKVFLLADASATARARQEEIGRGNRFEGENKVPRGLGRKVKDDDRGVS